MSWEFITTPKYSKVNLKFNSDFWMLIRKPKLCSNYIRLSRAIKTLVKWLPSKVYDRLSKLWSWYKVLSREKFGTFINSVNILGIKDKVKHKQRNSHGFPFHWNLTYLWDFVANSTGKSTSFKMVAFLSTEKDPPFWDNHMGLIYSTLLVWWPDDFPNPFSPLRTECLLIGPLISFSQKCPPSSTFPEFPDPLTFMTLSGIVSLNYFQDCWVVCQLFPVP